MAYVISDDCIACGSDRCGMWIPHRFFCAFCFTFVTFMCVTAVPKACKRQQAFRRKIQRYNRHRVPA